MSNGYKSQEIKLTTLGDLLGIINAMGQGSAERDRNQQGSAIHLGTSFKNANTIEELNNLLPAINTHNAEVATSGNEEYILDYSDKQRVFKQLPMAYEKLEGMYEEYSNKNPEELAGELLKGGWAGFAEREKELIMLQDIIEQGKAYNYNYRGDGTYSQKLLEGALTDRINGNNAAFEAIDTYKGDFTTINPDGSINEDGQRLLGILALNIVQGDAAEVQKTINSMTTQSISGYNKESRLYTKYNQMIMKHPQSPKPNAGALGASEDADVMAMLDISGYGSEDAIPIEYLIDMKNISLENAKSFNIQHRVANGILYDENPVWEGTAINPDNIPGYGSDNLLDGLKLSKREKFDTVKTGKVSDPLTEQILDTSELKEDSADVTPAKEKPVDVTPAQEKPVVIDPASVSGSPEYKQKMYRERKQEEKKSSINYINQIMPEVELKNTERKGMLDTRFLDANKETMHKDVKNIIDIVGGVAPDSEKKLVSKPNPLNARFPKPVYETIDYRSELEKAIDGIEPYSLSPTQLEESFFGLQKIIDRYNKEFKTYEKRLASWKERKASTEKAGKTFFTPKPTPNNKLAVKILTRYNTIREKMIKMQSR